MMKVLQKFYQQNKYIRIVLIISMVVLLQQNSLAQTGNFTISSGATVKVNGAASIVLNSASFQNSGTYVKDLENFSLIGTSAATISGVNTSFNDLNISNTGGVAMTASQLITCNNFTIADGSKFTIGETSKVTVNGTLSMSGAESMVIRSNASSTGSLLDAGVIAGTVGTARVERYLSEDRWHLTSIPVTDQSIATAFIQANGNVWAKRWNSTTGLWENLNPTNGLGLSVSRGYAIWCANNNTANFINPLNTGDYIAPLNRPATQNIYGWNLIGNPYPSAIDWESAGLTKTDVNNNFYVWNGATYATYNGTIHMGVPFGTTRYIPAMQGFYVQCSDATNHDGALTFSNTARLHHSQAYYKQDTEPEILRLTSSNSTNTDETVLVLFAGSTLNYESSYDVQKMFSDLAAVPQIYTLAGSTPLVINCIPEVFENLSIPVGFRTGVAGNNTIYASEITINSSLPIYLEDNFTGAVTDLRQKSSYSFTSETGDFPTRFNLLFGTNVTDIQDVASEVKPYIFVNQSNIYVRLTGEQSKEVKVNVYSTLGVDVYACKHFINTESSLQIPKNFVTGIYVVRLTIGNQTFTKKIFIN